MSIQTSPVLMYPGVPATQGYQGLILPADIGKPGAAPGYSQGCARCRPFPWPFTVDSLGVAFPSGLMGILCDGTQVDDYSSATDWQGGLIAVPSSLPGGYTLNDGCSTWNGGGPGGSGSSFPSLLAFAGLGRNGNYQPWLTGQHCYGVSGGAVNGYIDPLTNIPGFPRLLVNGGLWDHLHGPMCQGQQVNNLSTYNLGQVIVLPSSSYPGTQYLVWGEIGVQQGCRNIFLEVVLTTPFAPIPTLTSCNLVLYRNSDWSPIVAAGGTIVSSTPVTFTPYSTGTSQAIMTSIAGFKVPDGKMGYVFAQLEMVGNGSGQTCTIPSGTASLAFCQRVDIPLPWTTSNIWQGTQYVVPGGYNASILAAPNLRTPTTLTSSYQSCDHSATGDDEWLIVQAILPPGTYTLSCNNGYWNYGYIYTAGGSIGSLNYGQSSQGFTVPAPGGVVLFYINNSINPLNLQVM